MDSGGMDCGRSVTEAGLMWTPSLIDWNAMFGRMLRTSWGISFWPR